MTRASVRKLSPFLAIRARNAPRVAITTLLLIGLTVAVVGLAPSVASAATTSAPTHLTVNELSGPVDVDNSSNPLLGWESASTQTSYEVQVSAHAQTLGTTDVWDTGQVSGSSNSNVTYAGLALEASSAYAWRVRVWDSSGIVSAWSATATFGTGPGSSWSGAVPIWTASDPGIRPLTDFTYTGRFTISTVAASINFREKDTSNFYMWQFRTDGTLKEHKNVGGTFTVLNTLALPLAITAGTAYDFQIVASGTTISTSIKLASAPTWLSVGTLTDSTFGNGAIGFRTGQTESFSVSDLVLTGSDGTNVYSSDFSQAGNTDFAACGPISAGTRVIQSSRNCEYNGSGSTSNNWAFLRGTFTLPTKTRSWVHLYVTASSTSPARQFVAKTAVNGTVVGIGPARPVGTETRYDGYNVTQLVTSGANVISAQAYTTSGQQYEAEVIVRFTDGTQQVFGTGSNWKALNGSLALPDAGSIGTSYYSAPKENYQGSRYPFGYQGISFDDSSWAAATVRPSLGALTPTPTAKVAETLKTPASVVEYSPGNYFINYGRTWLGGMSLNLAGTAGQNVTIRYGQVTSGPNTVKYQTAAGNNYEDIWTLRGGANPVETWGIRVFRYVNVLGAPSGLSASAFTADAYVYPFDVNASTFTSANANLNTVWQFTKNSIEALNLNGYVDSYERERGFYEADDYIQLMANVATGGDSTLGNYSSTYLLAHRTWPTEWPFYTILSFHDAYLYSGNLATVSAAYTQLQSKLPDQWYDPATGLIKKTTGNTSGCGSATNCDIVDWPTGDRDGYVFTPYNTVVNSIAYRAYSDMADLADALGKSSDASTYRAKASTIRNALNSTMWDASTGAYSDGSLNGTSPVSHDAVHASAFAIAMGVATADNASTAASYLGARGMACSVYCADFMVQAAFEGNQPQIGDSFLTSTDSHSWMNMIAQGAGATMEGWSPADKSNLTYSHPWSASPASNIPGFVLGIKPTSAGYHQFEVKPQSSALVPWANGTVPTPNGPVGAAYDTVGSRTDVGVLVPSDSIASVSVPTSSTATTLYVDGQSVVAVATTGFLTVTGIAPGCHVVSTSPDPSVLNDSVLTSMCARAGS